MYFHHFQIVIKFKVKEVFRAQLSHDRYLASNSTLILSLRITLFSWFLICILFDWASLVRETVLVSTDSNVTDAYGLS